MASLYNRATPSQARILRIVEGACINAKDAHPGIQIDRRFARSVAKRAAGTLSAQWADVLAAGLGQPSDGAAGDPSGPARRDYSHTKTGNRNRSISKADQGKRPSLLAGRFPLARLHKKVAALIKPAKIAGQTERVEALIAVCRMIAALQT